MGADGTGLSKPDLLPRPYGFGLAFAGTGGVLPGIEPMFGMPVNCPPLGVGLCSESLN